MNTGSLVAVLLVLALLLSAAGNEPIKPSPKSTSAPESERPQIAQKPNAGQAVQNTARPSITPPDQTKTPNVSDHQNNADATAQKEATYTGLLVIVGLLAVILNYCTTKSAADAAKQSARAAELGLKADRPYLLVEDARIRGFPPSMPQSIADLADAVTEAVFTLRNYGKGPALVEEIVLRVKAVVDLPPPKDFTDCRKQSVVVEAVPSGGCLKIKSDFVEGFITDIDIAAIKGRTKTLIAYGRVIYRDVFKEPYETGFFWIVEILPIPAILVDPRATPADEAYLPAKLIRADSKDRNYHT
jgi:hypothetical protein